MTHMARAMPIHSGMTRSPEQDQTPRANLRRLPLPQAMPEARERIRRPLQAMRGVGLPSPRRRTRNPSNRGLRHRSSRVRHRFHTCSPRPIKPSTCSPSNRLRCHRNSRVRHTHNSPRPHMRTRSPSRYMGSRSHRNHPRNSLSRRPIRSSRSIRNDSSRPFPSRTRRIRRIRNRSTGSHPSPSRNRCRCP